MHEVSVSILASKFGLMVQSYVVMDITLDDGTIACLLQPRLPSRQGSMAHWNVGSRLVWHI